MTPSLTWRRSNCCPTKFIFTWRRLFTSKAVSQLHTLSTRNAPCYEHHRPSVSTGGSAVDSATKAHARAALSVALALAQNAVAPAQGRRCTSLQRHRRWRPTHNPAFINKSFLITQPALYPLHPTRGLCVYKNAARHRHLEFGVSPLLQLQGQNCQPHILSKQVQHHRLVRAQILPARKFALCYHRGKR